FLSKADFSRDSISFQSMEFSPRAAELTTLLERKMECIHQLMQGIIDLHHDILFFLILILVFVCLLAFIFRDLIYGSTKANT
ncbi:hypothetical protein, partial [Roseicella aquatilis]|uniref:hypothetical protein n=1 Tax=Roseicella aquatilis TaxID=2527868 RepID=UPI001981D379